MNAKTFRKFIDDETETDQSRGVTRYFIDSTETHTLNSDNTDDADIIRMRDLIKSSVVFLDVRNDDRFPDMDFIPVEILTKTLKPKKSDNAEIGQYSINFRFAFEEISR